MPLTIYRSDIDLDVSLLDSVHGSLPWSGELEHVPPFKDHRPPPPPSGPEGPGRKDRDDDMPLHVRVKTSKGNIKMKFVEWEMGQRLLRNRVESALGNIEGEFRKALANFPRVVSDLGTSLQYTIMPRMLDLSA